MRHPLRSLLPIIVLVACRDSSAPPPAVEPVLTPPAVSPVIADAAHGGQNPHFYFLKPLVPPPAYTGVFDRTQEPVVEICELEAGRCRAPLVARFTTGRPDDDESGDEDQGVRPEFIRVSSAREMYRIRWHTNEYDLDPEKTYRISVLVSGATLGYADLDVVPTRKDVRNVNTNEFIPLIEGKTLPIKFRIEQGAITAVEPGQAAPIGADGGTVSAADGNASVTIPPAALTATTEISVGPSSIPAPNSEGWASVVELGPAGTTFAQPVTLTMRYAPEQLPGGVPASALTVFTWDGTGWEHVPGGQVDETNNTVSVPISHFSYYYVGIAPNAITPGAEPGTLGLGQQISLFGWAFAYAVIPRSNCFYAGTWPNLVYQCVQWADFYSYPLSGLAVHWFGTAPGVATVPAGPTYTNIDGQTNSPPITGLAPGFTDVLATSAVATSVPQRLTVLPWNQHAAMTTPRWGLVSVTVGQLIYTIGGNASPVDPYPGQAPSATVESFNTLTGQWTTLRSLPAQLEHAMAAELDGSIYVIGGWACNLCAVSTVYRYEIATDSWTQLANAPYKLYGGIARTLAGSIYFTSDGCCGSAAGLHRFDPATSSWTRLASPPQSHGFAAGGGVIGGKLYIAGGESSGGGLDVYDPAADTWTSRASMPAPRQHGAGVVVDNKLVVVGGVDAIGAGVPSGLISYDPSADAWTPLTPLLTTRQLNAAALVAGRIHAIGGNTDPNQTPVAAVESYLATSQAQGAGSVLVTPGEATIYVSDQVQVQVRAWDGNGGELVGRPTAWSSSQPSVATVSAGGVVSAVAPGSTLIVATVDGVQAATAITVLSRWTTMAPMITPRWGMATVAIGNSVFTFGGNRFSQEPGGPTSDVVEVYDAATDQWSSRASVPAAREHSTAVAAGGLVYVIGGWACNLCGDSRLYVYDPVADFWTQGASSPFPLFGSVAGEIAGRIYVTTSGCCGSPNRGFAAYSIESGTWSVLASSPRVHGFAAGGGVIDGKLYVAGGEGSLGALDVYDPVNQIWSTRSSMPVNRQHGTGVVHNGKLYIFGGENAGPGSPSDVLVYDPATDTWSVVAQLPTPRQLNSAALVDGFMFMFGGNTGSVSPGAPVGVVERYRP